MGALSVGASLVLAEETSAVSSADGAVGAVCGAAGGTGVALLLVLAC